MSDLSSKLTAISAASSKEKPALYHSFLKDTLTPSTDPSAPLENALKECLNHVCQESIGLVISRQLLQDFIEFFSTWSLEGQSPDRNEFAKKLWQYAIEKTQARVVAFEEQVSTIREKLAEIYESEESWSEAARYLIGIPLESGHRPVSDEYKLRIYIKIVQLFLEDEESVTAESYLNRAALIINPSTSRIFSLQFKACQARILDFKRDFLKASPKYHELSYLPELQDTDQIDALRSALICAVLAPACPQRSRLLATLYKDERVRQRAEFQQGGLYQILEKMYLDRLLNKKEVEQFSENLKPHQLARHGDNTTVLDRAVTEHNLVAASKLYNNIYLNQLGALLSISEEQAELVAMKMISDGNMEGTIDQIEKILFFTNSKILPTWDAQISGLCHHLDGVADRIAHFSK